MMYFSHKLKAEISKTSKRKTQNAKRKTTAQSAKLNKSKI